MTVRADQPTTTIFCVDTWGADGTAGYCADPQRGHLIIALSNGVDRARTERTFGPTNAEGVHGEHVKEYHMYVDAPTISSSMKDACNLVYQGIPR